MEFEKQLEEWMKLDYVLPEDLPNIELYMDQVTTFLEEQLKNTKRFEEDKIFTKTMINNYTKNHLLPPSNKKKYSRNHMILLIYIYYLKNFLSISDIKNLLDPLNEHFDEGEVIVQYRCPVLPQDTAEDVAKKVHALEDEYYPQVIERLLSEMC